MPNKPILSKWEVTYIPKNSKQHATERIWSHCEADVRCQIRVKENKRVIEGTVKFIEIFECEEEDVA